MTTVRFHKKGSDFFQFEMFGHSGYGEEGFDIVCSAVSASVTQTHILLEDVLGIKVTTEVDAETTHILIKLPETLSGNLYKDAQNAILAFQMNMASISQDYSQYIEVLEVQHNA